jgi:DNA-binding NarL/FixJ family response regulator
VHFVVLIDSPRGFALKVFESQEYSVDRLIVATRQACPEYLEDLWGFQPAVLLRLEEGEFGRMLPEALIRANQGERYRIPASVDVLLTSAQRQVLRYVAQGWDDKTIAKRLSLKRQTVANHIAAIRETLYLKNRTCLTLYYWSIDPIIECDDSDDERE